MSDTDLIVPIRLHTLVANKRVPDESFDRWYPDLGAMLNDAGNPEPPNPTQQREKMFGVHVQWELPEVLTRGHYDAAGGETTFPLVPNRWLVVRYSDTRQGTRQAAGWVVHSDYLQLSDYDPSLGPGTSRYLTDRSPGGSSVDLHLDLIGRHHTLSSTAPWIEPERREPFLTAIGPGLPAFAAFASYHKNVFCFHDTLQDLVEPGFNHPADNELSYLVVGWYSEVGADFLTRARDIPGLLPPGSDTMDDLLHALEWKTPGDTSALRHSRYLGSSLGIAWRSDGNPPESTQPVGPAALKLAVGHSTADAASELIRRQTRSNLTGDLVKALFNGTIETYGLPDGAVELDEATRRAWYAGSDGGHLWEIVAGPSQDPEPVPPTPAWLDALNRAQAEYDDLTERLARTRPRLWDLWWMRNLPEDAHGKRPEGFDAEADRQLDPANEGTPAAEVKGCLDRLAELTRGEDGLPHGDDPEDLQAAIHRYADDHDLPAGLELKRTARDPYYSPADPVVVITGAGGDQALGRDLDDPLPCRLPSALLTSILIDDTPTTPDPGTAPTPNLTDLPAVCATLVGEFALLDTAANTPAAGGANALETALANPDTHIRGALPEYTGMWQQPWTPMYLQWEIRYCPTPFRSDDTDHWTFDGTTNTYRWKGTGAQSHDGNERRWPAFHGRSYLTPTTAYVLREQVRRYLDTFTGHQSEGLAHLLEDYAELDVLSQTLDGFNDWLLELDGSARLIPTGADPELLGDPQRVPDPGRPDAAPGPGRFQPVRAGQFFFDKLRITDRFGRTSQFMSNPDEPGSLRHWPAPSVRPDPTKPLYPDPLDTHRFIQLPPRLLQPARVRLEPVRAADNTRYTGAPPATDPAATPVVGWLMLNHLDRTLLVYAPDGSPLGELRVVAADTTLAWNVLPHAPHPGPDDPGFTRAYPQLSKMLTALLPPDGHGPRAFEALLTAIDQSLQSVTDPGAEADRSPARLIGRPLALIRAELAIQLQGPPPASPAWDRILSPPPADYPGHEWPVKLGAPERLTDGLIGYYASADGPGGDTDYDTLNIVEADLATDPYLRPITNGADLALPAKPGDQAVVHRLTLLADPHTAVHATTDILPVTALALDADLVQQALDRIEVSFRLDPLLAPTRAGDQTATASPLLGEAPGHPLARLLDGNLGTHYLSHAPATAGDWIALDLGDERAISRVDLYPTDTIGAHRLPACDLESSTDGEQWTPLGSHPAGQDIHATPAEPVTARHIRVRFTDNSTAQVAIRSFTATTDAGDNGLVMPRPAAWFGDWTWAEPNDHSGPVPSWARLPILPADTSASFDDPTPTARAGYLQLRPRRP